MDDNRGTSLVVPHTEKGREAFAAIADSLQYIETPVGRGIAWKPLSDAFGQTTPQPSPFLCPLQDVG